MGVDCRNTTGAMSHCRAKYINTTQAMITTATCMNTPGAKGHYGSLKRMSTLHEYYWGQIVNIRWQGYNVGTIQMQWEQELFFYNDWWSYNAVRVE